MQSNPTESKRIRKFRDEIIKEIPRFPNTRATLEQLQAKGLGDLIIIYANWMSRLAPPRKRSVVIRSTVTADRRWKTHSANIRTLFDKVRNGDDLGPHLSEWAYKNGYTPASRDTGPEVDKWADKDMLLNVMGFHHFHLSHESEREGRNKRTKDVLFAALTRGTFTAIGIFDHSVFDSINGSTGELTAERQRLWQLYEQHLAANRPGPGVYVLSLITTAGTTIPNTELASRYTRIIRNLDEKLDSPEYVAELLNIGDKEKLERAKLEWAFNYLDLGLYDKTSGIFHQLQDGPI